jgi:hypothetical protein
MEAKLPTKISYWSNNLQKEVSYVQVTKDEWENLPKEDREIFYNPIINTAKYNVIWFAKKIN